MACGSSPQHFGLVETSESSGWRLRVAIGARSIRVMDICVSAAFFFAHSTSTSTYFVLSTNELEEFTRDKAVHTSYVIREFLRALQ